MQDNCMACLPTFAEFLDTKSEIACIFSSNRSVNVICYVMSVQPHTYPLPAVLADSWGTKWKIGLEIMVRGGPFRKEDVNTWWKKWNIIITFTFLYPTWWKEKHDLHFHFFILYFQLPHCVWGCPPEVLPCGTIWGLTVRMKMKIMNMIKFIGTTYCLTYENIVDQINIFLMVKVHQYWRSGC